MATRRVPRCPMKSVRRSAVRLIAIAGALFGAALITPSAGGAASGWADSSLDIVGGPVAAGNVALVLDVSADHELEISGVNASTGSSIWSHAFSPSQITVGAAFEPIVIGSTALVLSPAGALSSPLVTVEGVNAATGQVTWKLKSPLDLSDAPVVCDDGRYFCFPAFATATTTDLVAINPLNGAGAGLVPGLYRNVGVAVPGLANSSDLWQSDASTPTFVQTSPTGQIAWRRTVASLFGSSKFGPNYGYGFIVERDLDIGEVGYAPSGHVEPLAKLKTVGINSTSGAVVWSSPGVLDCGGTLQFLTPLVDCIYTGNAVEKGTSPSLKGVTLTLAGVDAGTGKTTWSEKVSDVEALSLGTKLAFSDDTHVVVETTERKWALLDVSSGSVAAVSPGETFWCEKIPTYRVTAIQGEPHSASRVGEPQFDSCSDNGKKVAALPSTTPSSVGVDIDNHFIWASSTGLRAIALA